MREVTGELYQIKDLVSGNIIYIDVNSKEALYDYIALKFISNDIEVFKLPSVSNTKKKKISLNNHYLNVLRAPRSNFLI